MPLRIAKRLYFDTTATGPREYRLSWRYADEKDFAKNADWAQVVLVTNSSGGKMSPIYIRGIRFSAPAGASVAGRVP